ncbi:hypothetical protein Micbo1qcDRAFT_14043 [Microdochium bolleyi]|uniref:Uncharacterized protein n=1 Tax=Microdochium bolleyi TaxID=196109 RepID=A0A136IWA8_9PEZI|nr:hypothetical protein Micbo1qcDRAFT_14043 [Microdochium bolleyi]
MNKPLTKVKKTGRLVRLIPDSDTDPERASLKELFNHRLPEDHALARAEWLDIVESRHPLWGGAVGGGGPRSPNNTTTTGISSEKRELIRSIFNIVNMEIVKRARPSSVFNFSRASIGNLFLTGGRVLTGSLESAVYLLATICGVPEQVRVVPAINSSFTHHISAGLANGDVITGQNSISHPSAPTALPDDGSSRGMMADGSMGDKGGGSGGVDVRDETAMLDLIEDATLPGSLPTLRKPYITFNKGGGNGTKTPASTPAEVSRPVSTGQQTPVTTNSTIGTKEPDNSPASLEDRIDSQLRIRTTSPSTPPAAVQGRTSNNNNPTDSSSAGGEHPLPARIDRIWYINPYGHEIWPPANPKVVRTILDDASAVIYSIGSLYTSIVPSLVLRGVGSALANSRSVKHKILILNSSLDRETSGPPFRPPPGHRGGGGGGDSQEGPGDNGGGVDDEFTAADFVRAIVRACVQSQGELPARMARRSSLSYKVRQQQQQQQPQEPSRDQQPNSSNNDGNDDREDDFDNPLIVRRYVTHLVYLEGHGAPKVDRQVLAGMGVECIRVYGRREGGGGGGGPTITTTTTTDGTNNNSSSSTEPPVGHEDHPGGTTPFPAALEAPSINLSGEKQALLLHQHQHPHQLQSQQQQSHGGTGTGTDTGSSGGGGGPLRYDVAGLARALEAVVVKSRREMGGARSRRNTSGQ